MVLVVEMIRLSFRSAATAVVSWQWNKTPPEQWVMSQGLRDFQPCRSGRVRFLAETAGEDKTLSQHSTLWWANRARVLTESLARLIAAIRITSVRWRSYLPLKTQNLVLVDPAFVALRFESRDWRSLVQYSFYVELQNGLRELAAFAEH